MTGSIRRFTERARRLDDWAMGRPVPDVRPLRERLVRPRPAVWSRPGRIAYGLVLVAMFAVLRWLPETLGALAVIGLFGTLMVVVLVDERRRARTARGDRQGDLHLPPRRK